MAIFWDLQLVWGESNKLSHFKQRHIKMVLCSSSRSNVVVFNWSHQLMFFFNRQSLHAVAVEACVCQCVCARVWVCLCVDLWVCACEWVWVYGCYKGRIGMVLFAWLWLIGDELPPACTNKTFINAFTHQMPLFILFLLFPTDWLILIRRFCVWTVGLWSLIPSCWSWERQSK